MGGIMRKLIQLVLAAILLASYAPAIADDDADSSKVATTDASGSASGEPEHDDAFEDDATPGGGQ
jgi:hypothetical protein